MLLALLISCLLPRRLSQARRQRVRAGQPRALHRAVPSAWCGWTMTSTGMCALILKRVKITLGSTLPVANPNT